MRAGWTWLALFGGMQALGQTSVAVADPSAFQVRLRGVIQADGRAYPDNAPPVPSSFLVRRARIYIEGTVADFADFRIMPDFGEGKLQLLDAFVDLHPKQVEWVALRAGKFKSPFGLERLRAEQSLSFIERGLPTNLVPDRDIGVSLHGRAGGGRLSYELAVVDGAPDGANVDGDVDGEKDVVARVFSEPFRSLGIRALEKFGIGVAGTYGRERGSAANPLLPSYRTGGQQIFFSYRTGALAAGEHFRFSPQAYESLGPVSLLLEAVVTSQEARTSSAHARVVNHAAQVEVTVVLTGERPTSEGLQPAHPFDGTVAHAGALELVGRYGRLRVGDAAFPVYVDPATSAREAEGWTAGFNWYLTSHAKVAANFERTTFLGGAARGLNRPGENALLGRLQASF